MPLRIEHMACSRMPKWRLRPQYWPASKSPAPSKVSRALGDGVRSADPPISQGIFLANAFRTLDEEARLARPLDSRGKPGRSLSQPAGSARLCISWLCLDSSG